MKTKKHPTLNVFLSECGKAFDKKGKPIRVYQQNTGMSHSGYYLVYVDGVRYLHRLLAETFLPNNHPELLKEVDHVDRDKDNNNISNLKWVSRSRNNKNRGDDAYKRNPITKAKFREAWKLRNEGKTLKEIKDSLSLKCGERYLSMIFTGRRQRLDSIAIGEIPRYKASPKNLGPLFEQAK